LGIRIVLLLSVLPLILLGITDNAFAGFFQAGSNPSGSGGFNFPPESGDGPHSFSGDISACDPVTDCAPIVKEFISSTNEGFSGPIIIHEDWEVGPGPPWWDWHEVIQTPGMEFTQVQIGSTNGASCPTANPADPIPNPLPPGFITNNGQVIWIDFDQVPGVGLLQPGDHLCIWKEVNPLTLQQQLVIWEWPTIHKFAVGGIFEPIDATAVLIAGMQTNALSVLGAFVVIGAISFGALYISVKRKRN